MERVLVAYATRRGSTGEAALAIGEQFARAGFEVDVRPCSRARGPAHYRAVVVGSAVYDGAWEPSAVSYLRRHATALASRPTWLFQRSSPAEQPSAPEAVLSLAAWVGLEGPTVFNGQLGRSSPDNPVWRWGPGYDLPEELREWNRLRQWGLQHAGELVG